MTGTAGATEPVAAVRAELVLDRARASARSGDLDEALRILSELDADGTAGVAALDLLARVHAQRAEFTEADACWTRVQHLLGDSPGSTTADSPTVGSTTVGSTTGAAAARAAADGRHVIAGITMGRRPVLASLRPARLTLAAVPLAGVLVAGALVWSDSALPAGGTVSALHRQTVRADGLQRRLRGIQEGREQARAELERALDAAERRLRMRGVRLAREGDTLRVTFTTGLFLPDGVRLTPSGAALVGRLGERLPRQGLTVTVVGHAVAVPGATRGGSPIALARAQAAARRLATAASQPLTAFTLATADQRQAPYKTANRNRTVTLRLTPAPNN